MGNRSWAGMAVALFAAACGAVGPEGTLAPPEKAADETAETVEGEEALHQARPTLGGLTRSGFCRDLQEVLGRPWDAQGQAKVTGAVSCTLSYGVDRVLLWGTVSAGYPAELGQAASAEVNGTTVGMMDALLRGAPAARLFSAMSRTWSVYLPPETRVSPQGFIRCTRPAQGEAMCTLRDFVGFDAPPLYY